MPRRDALNEKKREQLMQERKQLQSLMLQARSTVRRSSLKERAEAAESFSEEVYVTDEAGQSPLVEEPVPQPAESKVDVPTALKEPLTEKDIFPDPSLSQTNNEKSPLTEKDLFPLDAPIVPTPQKRAIINVILPKAPSVVIIPQPQEAQPNEISPRSEEREVRPELQQAPVAPRETAPGSIYKEAVSYDTVMEEPPVVLREAPTTNYRPERVEKRQNRSKVFLVAALLAALLAGFGGYYLYTRTDKPGAVTGNRETKSMPPPVTKQPVPDTVRAVTMPEAEPEEPLKPEESEVENTAGKKTVVSPKTKPAAKLKTPPANIPAATEGLGQYKVISKAYFHDTPNESTRRKAFIIHWNNAVLTSLGEKDGFIYIIFTNHLGQTSKGWLRKKDLRQLN